MHSEDDFGVGVCNSCSTFEDGALEAIASECSALDPPLTSHCSLVFSAFGVAWESINVSGGLFSDSRYGCRKAGVRGNVEDMVVTDAEAFGLTRSLGELADEGEPASDSGRDGSCSTLIFEEVLSDRCRGRSSGKAVRLLEVDESLCLLLVLLDTILRVSESFLDLTRAGRPCLS